VSVNNEKGKATMALHPTPGMEAWGVFEREAFERLGITPDRLRNAFGFHPVRNVDGDLIDVVFMDIDKFDDDMTIVDLEQRFEES
jgi:hypothetical protein